MNKLLKTYLPLALTGFLTVSPAINADEQEVNPQQAENEYTYQYQQTQGELSGDRLMDRDRDQVRDKTRTHDPEANADQPAHQVGNQNQHQNTLGEQSGEAVQQRTQQRYEHRLDSDEAQSLRSHSQMRNRHSFSNRTDASRVGGGAGRQ